MADRAVAAELVCAAITGYRYLLIPPAWEVPQDGQVFLAADSKRELFRRLLHIYFAAGNVFAVWYLTIARGRRGSRCANS